MSCIGCCFLEDNFRTFTIPLCRYTRSVTTVNIKFSKYENCQIAGRSFSLKNLLDHRTDDNNDCLKSFKLQAVTDIKENSGLWLIRGQ